MPPRSARDVAHRDVPTCLPDDRLAEVQERVQAAGWEACIVVDDERVVVGRLGRKALAADADVSAEEAMTPGPMTVRPSIGADALLERMRKRDLRSYVVTTPDGRLVGLVRRSELEDAIRP